MFLIQKNKQEQRDELYLEDVDDQRKKNDYNEGEKTDFQHWAGQCLEQWDKEGKELKPILLKLSKIKN